MPYNLSKTLHFAKYFIKMVSVISKLANNTLQAFERKRFCNSADCLHFVNQLFVYFFKIINQKLNNCYGTFQAMKESK